MLEMVVLPYVYVQSIPEDIIILILARLKVKALIRLRCVCKCWCNLLRSPYFINIHYQRSMIKNESIAITSFTSTYWALSLYDHSLLSPLRCRCCLEIPGDSNNNVVVSWPCNGLLFNVCVWGGSPVLYNPSTRERNYLPSIHHLFPGFEVNSIGLGFDSKKNAYKAVVIFRRTRSRLVNKAIVYDTSNFLSINSTFADKRKAWRQIDLGKEKEMIYTSCSGLPFKGALHWAGRLRSFDSIILCFDLSTEEFRDIKLPDAINDGSWIGITPTILNDSLALFAYRCGVEKYIDIWVMKEVGSGSGSGSGSWTKQIRIGGVGAIPSYTFSPLFLWKNEAIIIKTSEDKLLWCVLNSTHEFTDTGIIIDDDSQVMLYNESLVSVSLNKEDKRQVKSFSSNRFL